VKPDPADALRAIAEGEALRASAPSGFAPTRRGSRRVGRRFVTDVARERRQASTRHTGRADPVVPEDLDEGCDTCALATLFRTVYTRRRPE
jgi:hypothetical protein